ncbi:hypothetical protein V8E53_002096 [Lactarius tabidus]
MGTSNQGRTVGTIRSTVYQNQNILVSGEKRTLTSSNSSAFVNSEAQVGTPKKARIVGPAHGQPMPLQIAQGSEMAGQQNLQEYSGSVTLSQGKGKRALQQSHGDTTHPLSFLVPTNDGRPVPTNNGRPVPTNNGHLAPNDDDDSFESEEDWTVDEQTVELSLQNPSRFAEVMAKEQPTWTDLNKAQGSYPTQPRAGPSVDNHDSSANLGGHTPAPPTPVLTSTLPMPAPVVQTADPPAGNAVPTSPSEAVQLAPESPMPISRANTDLVFPKDSTKLMLTHQHSINAFPGVSVAISFAREALRVAAGGYQPGGSLVQNRLQDDDEYAIKLISLPRARISLFRSEIKDRCNLVCMSTLLTFGSAPEITRVVDKQLLHYTYTFLRAGNAGLVRCGTASFANKFRDLFPMHRSDNGQLSHEVPIPMVALVATALYATRKEWHTGEHKVSEFSANAYLDVYQGHVNTFKHVLENRERAFHVMMSDIYSQASQSARNTSVVSVPIADIDLDALEED